MSMPPRKQSPRGFLRFFAGCCIGTAWVHLIVMIMLGIGSFGTGATIKTWMTGMANYSAAPGLGSGPGTGLGGGGLGGGGLGSDGLDGGGLGGGGLGGGGLGGGGLSSGGGGSQQLFGGMLGLMADGVAWSLYVAGIINILFAICGWIFFIGLGKLTYGYLDLEEQADRDHEAVQILLANSASR